MKLGYFCKKHNGKRDPEHEKATNGAESFAEKKSGIRVHEYVEPI